MILDERKAYELTAIGIVESLKRELLSILRSSSFSDFQPTQELQRSKTPKQADKANRYSEAVSDRVLNIDLGLNRDYRLCVATIDIGHLRL